MTNNLRKQYDAQASGSGGGGQEPIPEWFSDVIKDENPYDREEDDERPLFYAFSKGANTAYNALSQKAAPGMRWVPVGGQLPKLSESNIPIFRNIHTKKVYPEWVGGHHEAKQLYFGYGKYRVDADFSDIEYLDESPAVPFNPEEQAPPISGGDKNNQ